MAWPEERERHLLLLSTRPTSINATWDCTHFGDSPLCFPFKWRAYTVGILYSLPTRPQSPQVLQTISYLGRTPLPSTPFQDPMNQKSCPAGEVGCQCSTTTSRSLETQSAILQAHPQKQSLLPNKTSFLIKVHSIWLVLQVFLRGTREGKRHLPRAYGRSVTQRPGHPVLWLLIYT